jgi:hypothetical protein
MLKTPSGCGNPVGTAFMAISKFLFAVFSRFANHYRQLGLNDGLEDIPTFSRSTLHAKRSRSQARQLIQGWPPDYCNIL